MPHSLVINFTPINNIPVNYTSGKHLHALFLNLVNSIDNELAEYLHRSHSNKDFTISPLQVVNNHQNQLIWQHQKNIKKDSNCWWRITLLDDTLFSKLTKLWLNLRPQKPYHLGSGELIITSVLASLNSHSWANAISYQELYNKASETERNITFKIYTPTAFRQGKYDVSLPTAKLVFNSLWRKWEKYSNISFSTVNFDCLFPAYFDINTEIIIEPKTKFIGCIGTINYKILGEVETTIIKQINTLADYSFFSGLGRKTTMGFGVLKRLP
ncbi:CRISPR-associated endoribonuclease Cas6 [Cyanobacterium stanieri LEGE 03274]|uniref:CRISPR-associated endoribonuclease Cas6 n=1 Tax=Cyanobacterium stanieri LEGE 03274 TaxID=1828756 RepID=A0ABR9V3E7_9CHRO|nr:CRISPR-associated endoribonuclease Cas6 [Cyanobacterium stanieri]MBE9222407.1 CRISPR-associated endoribonuclease Cas6 [Cyanobacterium stanieri LEGE 03274]